MKSTSTNPNSNAEDRQQAANATFVRNPNTSQHELANWLDRELENLESRFADFITNKSLVHSIGR